MLPVILLIVLHCSCLYFSVVLRREMILIHSFFQTRNRWNIWRAGKKNMDINNL